MPEEEDRIAWDREEEMLACWDYRECPLDGVEASWVGSVLLIKSIQIVII